MASDAEIQELTKEVRYLSDRQAILDVITTR
jgi:hypothetical protein